MTVTLFDDANFIHNEASDIYNKKKADQNKGTQVKSNYQRHLLQKKYSMQVTSKEMMKRRNIDGFQNIPVKKVSNTQTPSLNQTQNQSHTR